MRYYGIAITVACLVRLSAKSVILLESKGLFSLRRTIPESYCLLTMLLSAVGCQPVLTHQTELPDLAIVPTCSSVPIPAWTPLPGDQKEDRRRRVIIPEDGSLQNPAWSPDSNSLLFTRFENGYNVEPADLFVVDLSSSNTRVLISDGSGNVNLPGSSWNPLLRRIVFSSSREPHDEIYLVDDFGNPGDEFKITDRADEVAYEPSLSPDGEWVVFESHKINVEASGIIVKFKIDGTMPYQNLTNPKEDNRQPNWSPTGDKILYQHFGDGQWDIWTMNGDGTNHKKITSGLGDKTDASFSPDGQWIVYSSNESGLVFANLYITPVSGGNATRLTNFKGYDGAPSWSPDGNKIAFESFPGDPDESSGTTLWIIDVPADYH